MTRFVRDNPVLSFFVLAFAGSWLVWFPWYFSLNGLGMLPFELPTAGVVVLHVLGLFAGPFASALIISRIVDGPGAPARLLGRLVQWRENALWYVIALVAVPIAVLVGYLEFPRGPGTPGVTWSAATLVLLFFALFVLGPVQEEVGWRGFALPRMQHRMHPLVAAVALGLVAFVWQLPLMVTYEWDQPYHSFADIGVYAVFLVLVSIVLSTLRNVAHGSLVPSVLASHLVNWSLMAAPLLMAEDLHSLVPATIRMAVLALSAVLFTRGRLGASVPDGEPLPEHGAVREEPAVAGARWTGEPVGSHVPQAECNAQCAPPRLSTTTPATINAMPATLTQPSGSPRASTPMITMRVVPSPAHRA